MCCHDESQSFIKSSLIALAATDMFDMLNMFGVFVWLFDTFVAGVIVMNQELYHVFFDMRRGKFEIEFTRGGGWVWWSCCETRLTMMTKFPKQEIQMCQLKKQIPGGRGNLNGRGDVDGAGMVGTLRAGHGGQPGGDRLAWDWCRWIILIPYPVIVILIFVVILSSSLPSSSLQSSSSSASLMDQSYDVFT